MHELVGRLGESCTNRVFFYFEGGNVVLSGLSLYKVIVTCVRKKGC